MQQKIVMNSLKGWETDMNLKEELNNFGFKFNKNFGQNFISDINLLNAICSDAQVTENSEVLEIGTGAGTLTQALSRHAKKVVSFEIDKNLTEYLLAKFQNINNVEIVFQDFLKMDLNQVKNKFNSQIKVVANLPYYITTPLIFALIESPLEIESLTLMVQKEVAERIVANEGTKEYGALSVSLQAISDVKITRIVSRNLFTPAPEVDSAIINIKLNNKHNIKDFSKFNKTVKACFFNRRKTLVNNLSAYFNISKQLATEKISLLELPATVRGEQLTVQQIIKLSEII